MSLYFRGYLVSPWSLRSGDLNTPLVDSDELFIFIPISISPNEFLVFCDVSLEFSPVKNR